MFPHTLGYFPMVAAWVIIIVHLETAKRDLTYITDRTMPEWVNGAVYGTVVIFWSFSVVSKARIITEHETFSQWIPPAQP